MAELYGAGPDLDYATRLQILVTNHVALWDVIAACHRPGSLDSAISGEGMETNDFRGFFEHHPNIRQIFFNGRKAADLFRKRVLPSLEQDYECLILPSTSPAHAAQNFAAKLAAWSVIKNA